MGLAVALGILAVGGGGLLSLLAIFFSIPLKKERITISWCASIFVAAGAVIGALLIFVYAVNQPSRHGMGP